MTKKELQLILLGTFILAILSQGLWLFELNVLVGWQSAVWLNKFLLTPYIICFLAAGAYLLPFMIKHGEIDQKVLLTFGSFFCVNITSFIAGEAVLRALCAPSVATMSLPKITLYQLLGIFTIGVFAFGHYYLTEQLITKVRKRQVLLFLGVIVFMFLFGLIWTLPFKKIGINVDLIGAVKMGAVQFWVCALLGLSGVITVRWFSLES
jgi:hypothetical protein